MTWWLWVALGLVLGAIELATPGGFFVIFFGVAPSWWASRQLAGLGLPAWGQWLAFPILAIVALRLFRRPLLAWLQPAGADTGGFDGQRGGGAGGGHRARAARPRRAAGDDVVGAQRGGHGRRAGQRCRVVAVNGLQLDIRPE
jgi:membrane protein implicated in regulation of membrane protease activity